MATHKGCEGVIKVSNRVDAAVLVEEVKDWSLTEVTEMIDASSLGTCSRVKRPGIKSGSGSLTVWWQKALTPASQGLLKNGAEIELELYPSGEGTDNIKVIFEAVVTEKGVSASVEGLVETSISYETSGDIIWSTIV